MLQPIITSNIEPMRELFKTYKVKRAYLFGSVCTEIFWSIVVNHLKPLKEEITQILSDK